MAFAAILIVLSYVIITLNYIVTMVESYLVISAGFIMLGFGGSRWTAPYVERYIGLAVSIGIKIVLIYCLVAAGFGLGVGWLTEAQGVGTSPNPAMTAFDVMGAAIIFMMLCWQIPKLFGSCPGWFSGAHWWRSRGNGRRRDWRRGRRWCGWCGCSRRGRWRHCRRRWFGPRQWNCEQGLVGPVQPLGEHVRNRFGRIWRVECVQSFRHAERCRSSAGTRRQTPRQPEPQRGWRHLP